MALKQSFVYFFTVIRVIITRLSLLLFFWNDMWDCFTVYVIYHGEKNFTKDKNDSNTCSFETVTTLIY